MPAAFPVRSENSSCGESLSRVENRRNLGLVMEGLEPYGLSVHPDGKRIAFTAGTDREEVWVLKDFLPALKNTK